MQIINQLDAFPAALRGGAVSIGKFDGMHLGHSLIVHRLKSYANKLQIPSIIVTFDKPPLAVLQPEFGFRAICTLERKIELAEDFHIDAIVVLPTTQELLERKAGEFFQTVIKNTFDAKVIVEGRNFLFGCNREGTAELMKDLAVQSGIKADIVDFVQIGDARVSSSNIRHLIENGRIELVNELMPQPYRMTGKVICGDQRGRTLGFPTANLSEVQTVLPKPGIYATAALIGGKRYASTTHIGSLLTFKKTDLRLEVYVHHFDGDLYGQMLSIDFLAYLRDVICFTSTEALAAQIQTDIQHSERIYNT
ncbi:MAG: riboflavin biosynthesis protein RibF [Planctomycetaceae bacterium]|jgi:riboflavin kinase/FMN adenylyltransferase|nr:riboflavin biosynthesis protein RibF [Planctomycetaceae bacterium]